MEGRATVAFAARDLKEGEEVCEAVRGGFQYIKSYIDSFLQRKKIGQVKYFVVFLFPFGNYRGAKFTFIPFSRIFLSK